MKAWVIAVNEWKQLLREREAVFWIFIGPVLFITFFGILMKPTEPVPLRVAILSQDSTGEVAEEIAALLREEDVEVERVGSLPEQGRTLVIPAGSVEALRAGDPIQLVLRTGKEESPRERSLQFKIQKALTRAFLGGIPPRDPAGNNDDPIRLTQLDLGIGHRKATSGFQRSVPAFMVMFVFMNLLIGGSTIAEDRASGRLRRIALAPVRKRDIILGKLLSRFTVGWIQILYLLVIGTWIFNIEWAQRNWFFILFMSLFAMTSASIGIFLGTIVRDPDKAISIAIWSAMILSPLGGLWWPLEVVGPTMRRIADFIPTGWAMQGVNAMLAFGAGPAELAPFCFAFSALLLATFALSSHFLKT